MESSLSQSTFVAADYVVFCSLIIISVGIGIFFACYGKGQNTTLNYFLGDRSLKVVPVALSFVVSFQSSILILGVPAEGYAYGMQFSIQCIGIVVSYLSASIIVVPVFHPLKLTSVYEYFRLRYGDNKVRFVAVALGLSFFIFYSGVVLFGTALSMQSVANVPFWASVIIFTSAAVLYTSIGGIKAVIWTDVFQAFVMIAGILAILIKCSMQVGGLGNVLDLGSSRFNFFDFNPDPTIRHTFWSLFLGSLMTLYLTFSQSGIQRINSTPNEKTAKRVLYIAAPVFAFSILLALFEGVAVYAYFYDKGCDPIAAQLIRNVNQIIPYTVMEMFSDYPGLPGLFIAAVSAASLSTISSCLSSMTAITYEDIIKVYFPNTNEKLGTYISKGVVVVFGLIATGIAFVSSFVKVPLIQIFLSFMGAFGGPVNGIFLLSIFFHRSTTKGVILGSLLGLSFSLWLIIGQNFGGTVEKTPFLPLGPTDSCLNITGNTSVNVAIDNLSTDKPSDLWINITTNLRSEIVANTVSNLTSIDTKDTDIQPKNVEKSGLQIFYSISYMYFNLIGTMITIIIGILVSLLTQPKIPFEYDKRCILPLSVFMPECLRRRISNLVTRKSIDVKTKQNRKKKEGFELEMMLPSQPTNE